jgi:hypothetical protein
VKLQVLNGCNCPKDAKLIALEGFIEQDRSAKTHFLNGEEIAVGNVIIDEAVFWSPSKAALHGDAHLGFFKMKIPKMKLGRIAMPKMKMGRIRLPNISKLGKQALKPLKDLTKGYGKFFKSAAKAGGKLLKSASKGASSIFDAMSQQPGADAGMPEEQFPEEMPAEELPPEEEYQTPEAAQPVEDQDGNLLGFLPMLATAATSLLPALTSGGGLTSMIPGLTSMLPGAAQGPVRQALPIAQRIRSQQLAKQRAKKAQQQNMLRQVLRTVAPQARPAPRPAVRPAPQYRPQPQPVVIREQAQPVVQYVQRTPEPAQQSGDKTTLYAIGAGVVLVGGIVLAMRTGNNTSRSRR